MISALHLLWICPVCAFVGFSMAALIVASSDRDDYMPHEHYDTES